MRIVPTPDWFIGKDVFVELFSFLVLIVFCFLAVRNYKLSKNKRFLYLGTGFGFIALAQLASVFTKLVLYYNIGPSQAIGHAVIASQLVHSVDIFYYAGFFFQKFLTLLGLFVIYRLPRSEKAWADYVFLGYFIVVSLLLVGEADYLFHLTALTMLILIVGNYAEIYTRSRFYNTKILITAFTLLGLSQLIFLLSDLDIMFVLGNIIELISYVILLGLIVRILKHGKEKKPYGHNIGHVGNSARKERKR